MQTKYNVLALGDIQTSLPTAPRQWTRRTLQVFTGKIAGQVTYYAPLAELEALSTGYIMADIEERAADRGAIEYQIVKVTPVTNVKASA